MTGRHLAVLIFVILVSSGSSAADKKGKFIERKHYSQGSCRLERLYDSHEGQKWLPIKSLQFAECGVRPVSPEKNRLIYSEGKCFKEREYVTPNGAEWWRVPDRKSRDVAECGVIPVVPTQERYSMLPGGPCVKQRLYKTPNGTEWWNIPKPRTAKLSTALMDMITGKDVPWYSPELCGVAPAEKQNANWIKPATEIEANESGSGPVSGDGVVVSPAK